MVSEYAVIQGGVVTNLVLWDGNTATWQPPADATMVLFDPTIHVIPVSVASTNQATLTQKATQAVTNNIAFIGQVKPSTAATQASAAYDQAVALSRQVDGIIRLLLGLLDTTSGT